MTNLKNLSNKELSEKLTALVKEERRITTEILWHLKEIQARNLYAALGYGSLFDYCVRGLNYSEPAAFRRIEAMRILRELPEIAQAIENGTLSVTAICLAQRVFKTQREFRPKNNNADSILIEATEKTEAKVFGLDEKRELINSLIGKSKRECEKLLAAISPQAIPRESTRVLTAELTEIKFVAEDRLIKKLERIRNLFAHKSSNPTAAALIEMMADLVLKKIDPSVPKGRPLKSTTPAEVNVSGVSQTQVRTNARSANRYIPQPLKRLIWQRDKARCTYKTNGTLCGSTHALEIDHIEPFALEGESTQENLRLLCRIHNRYRARDVWLNTRASRLVKHTREPAPRQLTYLEKEIAEIDLATGPTPGQKECDESHYDVPLRNLRRVGFI